MDEKKIQTLLQEGHEWPSEYIFKFIIKDNGVQQLRASLEAHSQLRVSEKESSGGKYRSFTAVGRFGSAEEVMAIYRSLRHIEGLMSL